MFGTVYRMRPKPGQAAAVEEQMHRWERERKPVVAGVAASYLFKLRDHPGELIGVAVFDSEAHYRANAEDPAQDRWYRDLRSLLETDPEWYDGDITVAF